MCMPCVDAIVDRFRKLFKLQNKSRKIAPDPDYDRDNVDFLPPIMIEERIKPTVSDPGVKEINADYLIHKDHDSVLTMKKVSSLALV